MGFYSLKVTLSGIRCSDGIDYYLSRLSSAIHCFLASSVMIIIPDLLRKHLLPAVSQIKPLFAVLRVHRCLGFKDGI